MVPSHAPAPGVGPYETARSSPEHSNIPNRDGGILRGHAGCVTDTTPRVPSHLPLAPSVAFIEPLANATDRHHRPHLPRAARSALSDAPAESDILVFRKRLLLSSSRSTYPCASCASPISDATGATKTSAGDGCHLRTPSLSRSETDSSDPALSSGLSAAGGGPSSHRHCLHQSTSKHNHVSLLSAALLAGDALPHESRARACGILRKGSGPGGDWEHGKVSFASGDDHTETEQALRHHPAPRTLTSRRVSLPPPSVGPRPSVSPEHYSEGPESPPRPIIFDAKAHATFSPTTRPPGADCGTSGADNAQAPPRRTLIFKDADGVEERAKARRDAAHLCGDRAGPLLVDADSGPPAKVHPADLSPVHTRSPSPIRGPIRVDDSPRSASGSHPKFADIAAPAPRRLTFAASPNELKAAPRGRLRRMRPRPAKESTSSSSDEEQPYVDAIASGSQRSVRQTPERLRSAKGSWRPQRRTASPAPRKLGGPERRRGSGHSRACSPAPVGRVALPSSVASAQSEEEGPASDALDYDEDDEDESEEEDDDDDQEDEDDDDEEAEEEVDDEDDEDEIAEGEGNSDKPVERRRYTGLPRACWSRGITANAQRRNVPTQGAFPRRESSPHPSVESISHPAAFSDSDFEEDAVGPDGVTDREFGGPSSYELPLVHSRQRSPAPFMGHYSNHGSPFTRSRIGTPAISDAEGAMTSRSSPANGRAWGMSGAHSPRPSISPVRSRSAALTERTSTPLSSSRSLSAAAVATTARSGASVLQSPEQAHVGLSSSPSVGLANSPDAWTALRSCLESAMLAGDQGFHRSNAPRRFGQRSGFSTPGAWSTVMSPSRLTDLEEDEHLRPPQPTTTLQALMQERGDGARAPLPEASRRSSSPHVPVAPTLQSKDATTHLALDSAARIVSDSEQFVPRTNTADRKAHPTVASKPIRILSSPAVVGVPTARADATGPIQAARPDHLDAEAHRQNLKRLKAHRRAHLSASAKAAREA
ncbi:unnamed protein product [Parajaminaea phylloscopi]